MANSNNNTIESGDSNLALSQAAISLQNVLHVALRHRWTILLTVVLFLGAAFAYLQKVTPIFTSESRLYVEQTGPRLLSEYEGVMMRSGNYLYTQAELLKSTSVLGAVADRSEIRALRTFAGVDNLVAGIRASMNVAVGRRDDIITVSFESPYPVEAAQIVNAVVASYKEYHSSTGRDTASEVQAILGNEKKIRDKELTDKFAELLAFTRENGVVSFDGKGGNIVFEGLAALSNALTEAEFTTLLAGADFEAVKSMENDADKIRQFAAASAGVGARPSVADREAQLLSELRQAEMELKDALYHCTEEHPSVQAIHAKIDRIRQELESQAREFADAYLEVLQLRWMTAKKRKDEIQASFDRQYLAARDLGVKAAEYSALQSEVSRAERLCEILDDRIKELNVSATEDLGALNISILEVARPASSPSRPQKARIMAKALAFGLVCGAVLALLRDWLDFRLRSSQEVSAILGIPVLGVVPKMSRGKASATVSHEKTAPRIPVAARDDQRAGVTTSSDLACGESPRVHGAVMATTEDLNILELGRKVRSELESIRQRQRMSRRSGGATLTTGSLAAALSTQEIPAAGSRTRCGSKEPAARPQAPVCEHEMPSRSESVRRAQRMTEKADKSARSTRVRRSSRDKPKIPAARILTAWRGKTTTDRSGIVRRGQKVHLESRSVVAEAYRTIRTAVFFGAPKEDAKTILITSPAPGDGKSTLVSNLAIAMAQAGQRTLVIDADFRKPVQHKIFEIDDDKGLANVFAGRDTIEQVVQPGAVNGLDIVTCGPDVPNPSELLNSDAFNEMLKRFTEQYDRIIVDSPPVAPVADAQILAAVCDITVLVLRAEKSTRRQAQHARDSLLSVGAKLLGAVVNDVQRKRGHYGYYSSYGGYGGYGYYGKREKKTG